MKLLCLVLLFCLCAISFQQDETIAVVIACPRDTRRCPDGRIIVRDPNNNCQFPPCNPSCPEDLRTCPDGSVIKRDPNNDCLFPLCPDDCPQDFKDCPDSKDFMEMVRRDPNNDCNFFLCKGQCRQGDALPGATCQGIQGEQCPEGYTCELGDQGNIADAQGWCCPLIACTADAKICRDGTVVGRNFNSIPACQWLPCPGECPDGGQSNGICYKQEDCRKNGNEYVCVFSGSGGSSSKRQGWCCPSCFLQQLCEYQDHIWRDYFRFLQSHKNLIDAIDRPGDSRLRSLLDDIYDNITCINELICKVNEKKEDILERHFDSHGIPMVRCLWQWIREIFEKSDAIENTVNMIKDGGLLTNDNQIKKADKILDLKTGCLLKASEIPMQLAWEVGHQIMYTLIPIGADDKNEICMKAEELGLLFHIELYHLKDTYHEMKALFKKMKALAKFPAFWLNNIAKCVSDFADLYYEIRDCCGKIEWISDAELVKKLGKWLSDAMDLRERMRLCFPGIKDNDLKGFILEINDSKKIKKAANKLVNNIEKRTKDFFDKFDDCIVKLRCLFLEYVEKFWQGVPVQPPVIEIDVEEPVRDADLAPQ